MCDTNILVRVVLSPRGPAAELLRRLILGHTLVTSPPQLLELLDVLRRPALANLHGLGENGVRKFVARIYKSAEVVPVPPDLPRVVPHDLDDNPIVFTAIAGQSEVLRTLDRHLHHEAVVQYCSVRGVRVLTDAELLNELRGG